VSKKTDPGDQNGDLGWNTGRTSFCEVREETIDGTTPLDVNPGRNGGIRVRGWDRDEVLVRTGIMVFAITEADARRLASRVGVETAGGRIRTTGPDPNNDERCIVNFELQVPRAATLSLNTENGAISLDDFQGSAQFEARNGGLALINVGGDLRGETTNGGVSVDLTGDHWDGGGLDVATHNGGVRLTLPKGYSAELETGTYNGGLGTGTPRGCRPACRSGRAGGETGSPRKRPLDHPAPSAQATSVLGASHGKPGHDVTCPETASNRSGVVAAIAEN
jgi:hypothetical protein